jgi:hypothetical protein
MDDCATSTEAATTRKHTPRRVEKARLTKDEKRTIKWLEKIQEEARRVALEINEERYDVMDTWDEMKEMYEGVLRNEAWTMEKLSPKDRRTRKEIQATVQATFRWQRHEHARLDILHTRTCQLKMEADRRWCAIQYPDAPVQPSRYVLPENVDDFEAMVYGEVEVRREPPPFSWKTQRKSDEDEESEASNESTAPAETVFTRVDPAPATTICPEDEPATTSATLSDPSQLLPVETSSMTTGPPPAPEAVSPDDSTPTPRAAIPKLPSVAHERHFEKRKPLLCAEERRMEGVIARTNEEDGEKPRTFSKCDTPVWKNKATQPLRAAQPCDDDAPRQWTSTRPPPTSPIYVRIVMSGRCYLALLDTGSEVSIIHSSLIAGLQFSPNCPTVLAANGTRVHFSGEVEALIYLDKGVRAFSRLLVARQADDIILGMDWLIRHRCGINFRTGTLHIYGKGFPLVDGHGDAWRERGAPAGEALKGTRTRTRMRPTGGFPKFDKRTNGDVYDPGGTRSGCKPDARVRPDSPEAQSANDIATCDPGAPRLD